MHDDEVEIDDALVRRLVTAQLPQWGDLPLTRVRATGTVNAVYRLGPDLCIRLPRVGRWANLDVELECLPRLARHVSLSVPEPIAVGAPVGDYPHRWAVYRWIEGEPYSDYSVDDEVRVAADLARFVAELRDLPAVDAPPAGREPLADLDESTREAIEQCRTWVDSVALMAEWDRAMDAPMWDGQRVWIHGDLIRPNLLVESGRLRAAIDFGTVGVGDPAHDLVAAWSVFGPAGRQVFRESLDDDPGLWERARGYALHQAAMVVPYYESTYPRIAALSVRTLEQILVDR